MTYYTELKKAAAYAAQDTIKFADEDEEMRALQQFHEEVDPETVLALVAESARLQSAAKTLERLGYRDSCGELWKPPLGQKPDFSLMDQLKAENEALRKLVPSKEIIWCACGDGHAANSYGAGFMDANKGVCANCNAAVGKGEQS